MRSLSPCWEAMMPPSQPSSYCSARDAYFPCSPAIAELRGHGASYTLAIVLQRHTCTIATVSRRLKRRTRRPQCPCATYMYMHMMMYNYMYMYMYNYMYVYYITKAKK
ncbi:hypothetical protein DVH05_017253 [Phytophthora capsici]|nr:hypothetical protein DVH05_017253 [Phytophthora capsici]